MRLFQWVLRKLNLVAIDSDVFHDEWINLLTAISTTRIECQGLFEVIDVELVADVEVRTLAYHSSVCRLLNPIISTLEGASAVVRDVYPWNFGVSVGCRLGCSLWFNGHCIASITSYNIVVIRGIRCRVILV